MAVDWSKYLGDEPTEPNPLGEMIWQNTKAMMQKDWDWIDELTRTGNLLFDPDGYACDRRHYTPEQVKRLFPGQ